MSQDHINPVPTIFKDQGVNTGVMTTSEQRKMMRNHIDQLTVSQNKLRKKSEREKSFKISGIKMFNHPELVSKSSQKLKLHSNKNSTQNVILRQSSNEIENADVDQQMIKSVERLRKSMEGTKKNQQQ